MIINRIMRLDELPKGLPARIDTVDWALLAPGEARRLRELGFVEGVAVELRHRSGWLGRGPIACKVGRMMVALRRVHAAAISVSLPQPAE